MDYKSTGKHEIQASLAVRFKQIFVQQCKYNRIQSY